MSTATFAEGRPKCPCCAGNGMHGHRPHIGPGPNDDWEGCTNCGETGKTFFTDARPNSCQGYRDLMRRVRR